MNRTWMALVLSALIPTATMAALPEVEASATAHPEIAGEAPAAAAQLVSRYEEMHDDPTPERIDALFAPNFEVFGSSLPASGLRRDGYIGFLKQLHGTVFRQKADTRVLLTQDKRLVLHWTLMAGERRMASGIDYFTLDENGRIRKIVGVY